MNLYCLQNIQSHQIGTEMSAHGRRSPGARLKDIFPPGFDQCPSISGSGGYFQSKPEQLYISLIERYDPKTPTESIIVRSAWYGKQTKSARHEFIVIEVEDIDVPGLINYLILDRNAETYQGSSKTISSQLTNRRDNFRISYDGKIDILLQECGLTDHKLIEGLSFLSSQPLHLYELVALANIVSNKYPDYQALDSSCYLFAGVIWDCMRLMRPTATYTDALAQKRGKCRWIRYTPNDSARQETFKEFQARLPEIQKKFGGCINVRRFNPLDRMHTLISTRILKEFTFGKSG